MAMIIPRVACKQASKRERERERERENKGKESSNSRVGSV